MSIFSKSPMSLLKPVVLAAMIGLCPSLSWAQPEASAASDYAILIVGDEVDSEVHGREKLLIAEIARKLKKPNRLPIYSYHFNKEQERKYCEKKLNVLKEDLLFIGIVALKERVPRKIVFRLDRIVTPARAAADIIARAEELVPLQPPAQPPVEVVPSPSPSPSASPEASPGPGAARYRVQLGVFSQSRTAQELSDRLKSKGYEARSEKMNSEGKEMYRVWVGTFQTKEDAAQANTELQADGFEKGFVLEGP